METTEKKFPNFLSKGEVATKLKVSKSTIERYVRMGFIKTYKMTGNKNGRCWFIEDEVLAFAESIRRSLVGMG